MSFATNQNSLAALLAGTSQAQRRLAVWNKGTIIPNFDAAIWRWDAFGHVIHYADYGDRNSAYGWEIDHIHAVALGDSDDISNLRPLHCSNNATLGGLLGAALKG